MRQISFALLGAALVAGCGDRTSDQAAIDSAARDIQIPAPDSTVALNDAPATPERVDTVYLQRPPAPRPSAPRPSPPPAATPSPAPAPAPAPPPAPAAKPQLEAGTVVEAVATKSITSRSNKPGETLTARIDEAITTPGGLVVIPAGSEVTLTIVTLKPAPNKSAKDGTIVLRATSVLVKGEQRPIDADVTFIEHTLKGRGVTTSEAAKTGAGAAAGAIIGKVIGGGTGAAAGAVVGGAAGAAVAVESADRDVVVPVGGKIRLALRSPFVAD
jgi:hypothetical protein